MAERFDGLQKQHIDFIEAQQMYFVATAAREGHVNVSPKGQDSLRVLGPNEIVWLNLTGSGNETAAHLLSCNRITLMWCAFAGAPLILRAYGTACVVHPREERWEHYAALIPPPLGARQYIHVDVDLVQASCGYAVPLYEYEGQRRALTLWAEKKGTDGIERYWRDRNMASLDDLPTGIVDDA
jgi:hypothetical protein